MNSRRRTPGNDGRMVSIHIRHCWRMNSGLMPGVGGVVVFQSTFAIDGE